MEDVNKSDSSFSNSNNVTYDSEDDNSDSKLHIDLGSPIRKRSPIKPTQSEQLIIDSIEDELEKQLTEKAEKSNLNALNVKNIIKHVVTNEHVVALLRKVQNPDEIDVTLSYEPKLTRAKAKELLSSNSNSCTTPLPWVTPKPTETHVLVGEDLQEDSSGDEYVPGADEESDDEKDGSIASESDTLSLPPPTPPTVIPTEDISTQTNWTEDGIFKIPLVKLQSDSENAATVALCTRSKINLTSTPLEDIAKSFIPPDITTDMYDMDCDDDDWKEFLKGFTEPLDEITTAKEDDDHDPEYNVLAEGELETIDKEELRMDKAVKISKKEVKKLWDELFEYIEQCSEELEDGGDNTVCEEQTDAEGSSVVLNHMQTLGDTSKDVDKNNLNQEATGNQNQIQGSISENLTSISGISQGGLDNQNAKDMQMEDKQILLLSQQMRQHVQMLAQNFILTYKHTEYHEDSVKYKEFLNNLNLLAKDSTFIFCTANLANAVDLVKDWENLLSNKEAEKETKDHTDKCLIESIQKKKAGNHDYVPTFPPLVLKTISNSNVFIYPTLLPRIPFKSKSFFSHKKNFIGSENLLLALGLEQFDSLVKKENYKPHFTPSGEVKTPILAFYISTYMMPDIEPEVICKHIRNMKNPQRDSNPIKTFFENNNKTSPMLHYIFPYNANLPPSKQRPEDLPIQWREYIYKDTCSLSLIISPIRNVHSTITNVFPHMVNNSQVIQNSQQLLFFGQSAGNVKSFIIPKTNIVTSTPVSWATEKRKRRLVPKYKRRRLSGVSSKLSNSDSVKETSLSKFVKYLTQPPTVRKLLWLFADKTESPDRSEDVKLSDSFATYERLCQGKEHGEELCDILLDMPMLNTPVKSNESNDVSSTTQEAKVSSKEGDSTEPAVTKKSGHFDFSAIGGSDFQQPDTSCQDTLDDKNATKPPAAKKEPSGAEKKRAKIKKEFLANLALASPEDPVAEKHRSTMFAMAYYDKMRETLELADYHRVMQILNEFEGGDAVDLYKSIEQVLIPKYRELADEFLLFLREKEAAAVGKLIPWIRMNIRSKFLRKLEQYFKDQPTQLMKIYKSLNELSQNTDIEKIKLTILPMIKGSTVLTELFLQNFLYERPTSSLLEGPYEVMDINKEMARLDSEEAVETIVVPNIDDKYGGLSCICKCHQIEDPEFTSRYRHCRKCGIKFYQGRVYMQTGRGLRPANITFDTSPNINHSARLSSSATSTNHKKKRSESSPSKHVISTKEPAEEETEDETEGKKRPKARSRSPRKTKKVPGKIKERAKPSSSKKSPIHNSSDNSLGSPKPTKRKRTYSGRKPKKEDKQVFPHDDEENKLNDQEKMAEGSHDIDLEPCEDQHGENTADELTDCDFNGSGESVEKPPTSPEQHTAESESEFCEESSQDNCESDSSSSESSTYSQSDCNMDEPSWQRDEDKIILETFQKEDDKEYAFQIISEKLKSRTIRQIRSRFSTLMNLLIEQIGNS